MNVRTYGRQLIIGGIAFSMVASPTLADASTAAPSVSPFVAMSYFASDTSRAALCGVAGANSAATTAAATTAATTAAAGPPAPVHGCVLPVADPAVAVPVAGPVPGPGFSLIGPLAAALAGVVAILVIANAANDDEDNPPVSPG